MLFKCYLKNSSCSVFVQPSLRESTHGSSDKWLYQSLRSVPQSCPNRCSLYFYLVVSSSVPYRRYALMPQVGGSQTYLVQNPLQNYLLKILPSSNEQAEIFSDKFALLYEFSCVIYYFLLLKCIVLFYIFYFNFYFCYRFSTSI